jgi:hypothetical protein
MGGWSLNDPCKLASCDTGGDQGAEEQIERDGGVGSFHLGDARLTGTDQLGETSLGQFLGFPAEAKTFGKSEPQLHKLSLLFGESEKLACRADLPTRGLKFLSLQVLHGLPHVLVVVTQSPSAVRNDIFRRCRCLLIEDRQDQDGIRVQPVDDAPGVIPIPNSKLMATRSDRGHGPGVRKREFLAVLNSPQEVTGLNSSIGRERRSLDLAS